MKKKNIEKIIFTCFLVFIAIAERLWFDLGPNIELITMATILTSIYWDKIPGMIAPLIIIGLTDAALGNTYIMLFTWSAFVIQGLFSSLIARKIKFHKKKLLIKLFSSSSIGLGASLWFYLWTNFGVWLLDSWGMYPKTLAGLAACFIAGLPFLKLNLLPNLVFIPLLVIVWETIKSLRFKTENYIITSE
jgi:hypothetical protein